MSILAALPKHASAFWPFTSASAAVPAYTLEARPPVLTAATNADPNPSKGLTATLSTSGAALMATGGPAGTIADVASTTSSGRISVYVVRPGDSLSDIAKMFGVSVNTIVWANNLKSRTARAGDTLIILPVSGTKHTIAKGDTLKSLAKKYTADADEIADFNGLDASQPLVVGMAIIIPGGEIAAPAPVVRRPSAPRILGGGGPILDGYYQNPVPGGRITQGLHGWNGIDVGAYRGAPILAAAGGTVIIARSSGWNGGYGSYVVITHGNGTQTLYGHLSSVSVAPGQTVSAGEAVGTMGNTGKSTGVHLHFEVRGAANPLSHRN